MRYLKQVKDNLTEHEWLDRMKNLLLSIKKEKEKLIKQDITSFDKDRINEFELEYDECIRLGY